MFDYDEYGNAFVDMRLHRLRVLITEQCDDLFLERGISAPSAAVSVLLFLSQKGHANITQIANALSYSHQLINHRLGQLEKAGFIQRFADVRDKRRWLIKLTAIGRKEARKIDQALPEIAHAFDDLFEKLGVDLSRTLNEIHKSLSRETLSERLKPAARKRSA
jgi:DNA-binding MarR family transcriptional regulator